MKNIEELRKEINKIDEEMVRLFEERMSLSKEIASYKNHNNLPIENLKREEELLVKNVSLLKNSELEYYYKDFERNLFRVSKNYQKDYINSVKDLKILNVKYETGNYDCIIKKGLSDNITDYIDTKNRKVLVISDSGVPSIYIDKLTSKLDNSYKFIFESGEKNKTFNTVESIISYMKDNDFSRNDLVIALGGGLVGDISAFISSIYMRGIEFINIPSTLLSMVDSSIGGKTAINFESIKNMVGSFYNPSLVLIDPLLLDTLSDRLFNEGLAEAIKMSITSNKELFNRIKNSENIKNDIEYIIYESLKIKKDVVEKDPKEKRLRKILNFGHTVGHAVESLSNGNLLHGEAVSIGMTYFISDSIKDEVIDCLNKYNLPISTDLKKEELYSALKHDKKCKNGTIDCIKVDEIGKCYIENLKLEEIL